MGKFLSFLILSTFLFSQASFGRVDPRTCALKFQLRLDRLQRIDFNHSIDHLEYAIRPYADFAAYETTSDEGGTILLIHLKAKKGSSLDDLSAVTRAAMTGIPVETEMITEATGTEKIAYALESLGGIAAGQNGHQVSADEKKLYHDVSRSLNALEDSLAPHSTAVVVVLSPWEFDGSLFERALQQHHFHDYVTSLQAREFRRGFSVVNGFKLNSN